MVQGCTSDAGKSLLVTALGRWLSDQGVKVAPFKPQNMALNSAVTSDGGEIGRGQAVQAEACRVPSHSDMNPVLLKPNTDTGAQVIIQGRALTDMEAASFHDYKQVAKEKVLESFSRLQTQYEAIVVEGAGSPAEINLRHNDIANMGFAEAADCPVVLIADIDKGGVFAHLVGTLALLSQSEQDRVVGFVINKFRGDIGLLQPGLDWLEERTGKPVFGVLPYMMGLHLEAEDALPTQASVDGFHVVVPALPRISNHTDFDALRLNPQVKVTFVGPGKPVPPADLIVLPGSKSVRPDLDWLRSQGWEPALARHLRYGGKVIGICGGFQMLGEWIHDPDGVEGTPGSSAGLGWLEIETTLATRKQLRNQKGRLALNNAPVAGYEIHAGVSTGAALSTPAIDLPEGGDGVLTDQILGTYLHGIFDEPAAMSELLRWAGLEDAQAFDYAAEKERSLQRLGDSVAEHLDTERLRQVLGLA